MQTHDPAPDHQLKVTSKMATKEFTPTCRLAVDLEAPFSVHLDGVLLAEHANADAALDLAARLRGVLADTGALRAQVSANLDAVDCAASRLDMGLGVLNALWSDGGAFESIRDKSARSAIWAAQTLLEQAHEAVKRISFRDEVPTMAA